MAANEPGFLALMAIGDAFGMKYEFLDHEIPVGADQLFYAPRVDFDEYQAGHYTDDTQMSLANAELLLKKDPKKIKKLDFVRAWLGAFKRDPRPGYSKYTYSLMQANLTPAKFCKSMDASQGVSSGAAMRAAPFGLLADIDLVKKLTRDQAIITHNTKAGVVSALAVSLSTHFLHHGGQPKYLEAFLDRHLGAEWQSPENGLTEHPANGMRIVSQALNALKDRNSYSQILLAEISQARVADTDTICAVASAIASRRTDLDIDVPDVLQNGVENGDYGVDYLKKIDTALREKFPRSNRYARLRF